MCNNMVSILRTIPNTSAENKAKKVLKSRKLPKVYQNFKMNWKVEMSNILPFTSELLKIRL